MKAIKTKDLTNLEWLKLRQTGIGGSDIATIMGENPYKTPYDLYIEKTSEIKEQQSEPAYWGHQLEDIIAKEFAKRNNLKLQRVNYMLRHSEYDWAIANIDRAIINPDVAGRVYVKDDKLTTDTILEIKTCSEYQKQNWGDEESDHVPDQYNLQCQWYMGITGATKCHLAVLVGGNKFRQYQIDFDPELFDIMLQIASDFWHNHVLARVPPEATTLENVKHKYPKADPDTTLEVAKTDNEKMAIINTFLQLKNAEKKLKQDIEQAQANIGNLMATNETLMVDGKTVFSYKNQSSNRFDSTGFKKIYPDLFTQFAKQSTSRVLRCHLKT